MRIFFFLGEGGGVWGEDRETKGEGEILEWGDGAKGSR